MRFLGSFILIFVLVVCACEERHEIVKDKDYNIDAVAFGQKEDYSIYWRDKNDEFYFLLEIDKSKGVLKKLSPGFDEDEKVIGEIVLIDEKLDDFEELLLKSDQGGFWSDRIQNHSIVNLSEYYVVLVGRRNGIEKEVIYSGCFSQMAEEVLELCIKVFNS